MSGSFESLWWNKCVHKLDLGLYSHPTEILKKGVRTHVNSKGKIPSIRGSKENGSHDTASCRTLSPQYNQLSYSGPLPTLNAYVITHISLCQCFQDFDCNFQTCHQSVKPDNYKSNFCHLSHKTNEWTHFFLHGCTVEQAVIVKCIMTAPKPHIHDQNGWPCQKLIYKCKSDVHWLQKNTFDQSVLTIFVRKWKQLNGTSKTSINENLVSSPKFTADNKHSSMLCYLHFFFKTAFHNYIEQKKYSSIFKVSIQIHSNMEELAGLIPHKYPQMQRGWQECLTSLHAMSAISKEMEESFWKTLVNGLGKTKQQQKKEKNKKRGLEGTVRR